MASAQSGQPLLLLYLLAVEVGVVIVVTPAGMTWCLYALIPALI